MFEELAGQFDQNRLIGEMENGRGIARRFRLVWKCQAAIQDGGCLACSVPAHDQIPGEPVVLAGVGIEPPPSVGEPHCAARGISEGCELQFRLVANLFGRLPFLFLLPAQCCEQRLIGAAAADPYEEAGDAPGKDDDQDDGQAGGSGAKRARLAKGQQRAEKPDQQHEAKRGDGQQRPGPQQRLSHTLQAAPHAQDKLSL